jgi:hypothetical protein
MKLKHFCIIVATTAALTVASSAVTVSLIGVANASAGLITLNGTAVSGRAIFVTTTGSDVRDGAFASLSPLLLNPGLTSANFDSALATLIGTTTAASPGIVRSVNFSNGVLASNATQEMGDAGNLTHLFLVAESGTDVLGFGAYTGGNVPTLGSVTFTPATAGDGIGIGTSVLNSGSGFQLAAVIPEPSAALLGALGALGLLRRRRN